LSGGAAWPGMASATREHYRGYEPPGGAPINVQMAALTVSPAASIGRQEQQLR
jgi:hypothetical protein